MSENNVAFGLVRYDEICAIALDRYLATSSISTRLEDIVGNYRHHAPDTALPDWSLRMRRIELRVKGAPSYPQSRLTAVVAANPRQWPRERGHVVCHAKIGRQQVRRAFHGGGYDHTGKHCQAAERGARQILKDIPRPPNWASRTIEGVL